MPPFPPRPDAATGAVPLEQPEPGSAQGRPLLRKALIARRGAIPERDTIDKRITAALQALLERLALQSVGFYWPIQGEFDPRPAVMAWLGAAPGRTAALPVVRQPAAPLDFHQWAPATTMREGRYGIPIPDGTPALSPDALLIPCVGFNEEKFRLGYGGGFYDRTLAALPGRPVAIGIAYEACRVALVPEPHDIPMDWLVTEAGVR